MGNLRSSSSSSSSFSFKSRLRVSSRLVSSRENLNEYVEHDTTKAQTGGLINCNNSIQSKSRETTVKYMKAMCGGRRRVPASASADASSELASTDERRVAVRGAMPGRAGA